MYSDFELQLDEPFPILSADLQTFQKPDDIILIRYWATGIAIYSETYGWWYATDVAEPKDYIEAMDAQNLFCQINRNVWVNGLHVSEINELYADIDKLFIPINLRYADGATADDLERFCQHVQRIHLTYAY